MVTCQDDGHQNDNIPCRATGMSLPEVAHKGENEIHDRHRCNFSSMLGTSQRAQALSKWHSVANGLGGVRFRRKQWQESCW